MSLCRNRRKEPISAINFTSCRIYSEMEVRIGRLKTRVVISPLLESTIFHIWCPGNTGCIEDGLECSVRRESALYASRIR